MENNDDNNKNNKNVWGLFVQPSTEPSSSYALFLDRAWPGRGLPQAGL